MSRPIELKVVSNSAERYGIEVIDVASGECLARVRAVTFTACVDDITRVDVELIGVGADLQGSLGVITLGGIRYSPEIFKAFADCAEVGRCFRFIKLEDGVVTVENIDAGEGSK